MRPLSASLPALRALAVSAVAGTVAIGTGCTKLVSVDLAVSEPCGQESRVVSAITSYRMVSSGSSSDTIVAFKPEAPQGMSVGLGDKIVVSLEGYRDDILAGADPTAPSVLPIAVGRTMPLTVTEGSLDVAGTMMVGLVDSFGGPRNAEGNCTEMQPGGRHAHTATFVPGANKVLLFGGATFGADGTESFLKTAEVYDPVTGAFTALPEPLQARAYHTATALPDGRVIILGGFAVLNGQVAPLINGLIVDLNAENPYVGDIIMRTPRAHHTATLLEDLNLLAIIGGCSGGAGEGCSPTSAGATSTTLLNTVEVYNPDVNAAQTVAVPNTAGLATPRAMHQAVAFPSGNTGLIVVAGGLNGTGALRSVEYFQVNEGSLVNVFSQADALPTAMVRHQMLAFTNGTNYLLMGGQALAENGTLNDAAPGSNSFIICDKTDNTATCRASTQMLAPRFGHNASLLADNSVVVMGGAVGQGLPLAERLKFVAESEPIWEPVATDLAIARERAAVTQLGGTSVANGFVNQLFYSGGHTTLQPYTTVADVDIYFGK